MAELNQYCTFYVGGKFYGINVKNVQDMTSVPLADSVIKGLINLRGQIVTAIDLRRRLGLKQRKKEDVPMNVIIKTDDGAVSLLVDEIGDVIEVDDGIYESPPQNLRCKAKELTTGAYKLKVVYKKRMLFCIFSCTNSVRQFILSAWLLKLLIVGTVEVKISLNLARRPTINSATAAMIVVNKAAKTPQ